MCQTDRRTYILPRHSPRYAYPSRGINSKTSPGGTPTRPDNNTKRTLQHACHAILSTMVLNLKQIYEHIIATMIFLYECRRTTTLVKGCTVNGLRWLMQRLSGVTHKHYIPVLWRRVTFTTFGTKAMCNTIRLHNDEFLTTDINETTTIAYYYAPACRKGP